MVDKIRPLKVETLTQGSDDDMGLPTEVDPSEDYASILGVAYGDQDDIRSFRDGGDLKFEDQNNTAISLTELKALKVLSVPLPEETTKSTTYQVQSQFVFPGTTFFSPTEIRGIGRVQSGGEGQFRVFDLTNGNVIAESSNFTNTTNAIIDLGAVSNLPTGEAIFEWQYRRGGGSNRNIYSLGGLVYS